MSDITVYESEAELREKLGEMDDMLAHIQLSRQAIEEQRGVLADQVQGAQEVLEHFQERRDALDRQDADLRTMEEQCVRPRQILQLQLDAKRDAKLGKRSVATDGSKEQKSLQAAETAPQDIRPVTKAQIEKLLAQRDKPKPALTLDPPGGLSQAAQIDRDLKLAVREKQERLNDASLNLRTNWNRSSGPQR